MDEREKKKMNKSGFESERKRDMSKFRADQVCED
jgi:hypothetical protein